MTLLIDANILLDVLQNRLPHVDSSSLIWKLCETEQVKGVVTSLTFANLVYILRRELSPSQVESVFKSLSLIFGFTELSHTDLIKAAELHWPDYEDALQSVIAERIHADFIITRNIKDFKQSKVMALTPAEFIARW